MSRSAYLLATSSLAPVQRTSPFIAKVVGLSFAVVWGGIRCGLCSWVSVLDLNIDVRVVARRERTPGPGVKQHHLRRLAARVDVDEKVDDTV